MPSRFRCPSRRYRSKSLGWCEAIRSGTAAPHRQNVDALLLVAAAPVLCLAFSGAIRLVLTPSTFVARTSAGRHAIKAGLLWTKSPAHQNCGCRRRHWLELKAPPRTQRYQAKLYLFEHLIRKISDSVGACSWLCAERGQHRSNATRGRAMSDTGAPRKCRQRRPPASHTSSAPPRTARRTTRDRRSKTRWRRQEKRRVFSLLPRSYFASTGRL